MSADSLDCFLTNILTQETRKRIQLHEEIVAYLRNPNASTKCDDMDRFFDGITGWIVASNFKVSLNGLEVISYMIDRMERDFVAYIPTVLPLIVDRLADNKEQVRNSSQDLLIKLMTVVTTPQYILERLTFAFSHKSPKVKEEMLICIQKVLNETGTAKNVGTSKLVPHVVKLLEDPSIPIRELAVDTLSVMYQYVGEKLRQDVMRREINNAKMGTLLSRFDELKNSGMMKADECSSSSLSTRRSDDELDRASNSSMGDPGSPRPQVTPSSGSTIKRVLSTPTGSRKLSLGNVSSPIGVDEDSFVKQFHQTSKINIYNAKDFSDRVAKVKDMLADQNLDWNKRVDALKEVRAWLSNTIYDAKSHPEFTQILVTFEPIFHATVRDLRSQVVREACITLAYMSQELGKDFSHFAETILPPLITLIPNSAKVMASSAMVVIKFILQNTHNHKLIPIVSSNLTSKSNVIRRQCCEFVCLILQSWPSSVVEKQLPVVQDAIRKGMADADAEARLNSRRAFWNFSENFKHQADLLLQSLDPIKQKQLLGEQQGSSSSSLVDLGDSGRASSTNGLAVVTTPSSSTAKSGRRYSGATTNHDRPTPSSGYGRRISKDRPDGSHATSDLDLTSLTDKMSKAGLGGSTQNSSNRSHQALYGTLRKSKAYSSMSSSKQSHASSSLASSSLASSSLASSCLATSCDEQTLTTSLKIARPRKSQSGKAVSNLPTPTSSGYSSSINSSMIDKGGRSRSNVRVSQSQPSSRSSSPAPRLSYITPIQPDVVPQSSLAGYGSRRRSTTGLNSNKSREGSRDSSPNRSFGMGRERRSSGQAKNRTRNLAMQRSTPGEEFLSTRMKATGASSTCDSDDVNSETSSVCSDGSSYWNCGRQVTEDTSEIIACLSSGSWSDRRDGLIALQHLLANNRTLSRAELKKVTDVFSRMFHDPHGKVFSVFMETLAQLVIVHHGDICDWLYILMTRLLAKTGADLLGSTQAKIQRTLDTVRSSFPTNQQFMLIAKLLIDQTQSPNLKVKVAMLCYLHGLTQLMSPSDFVNTSDVRLAISRIITWTTEPKSVDVRKAAQGALLSLHALNPPEFDVIMSVLPKTFQEGAERILQNRSHHSGQSSESHSLKDPSSPVGFSTASNGCVLGGQGGFGLKSPQVPGLAASHHQQLQQGVSSEEIYDSIRQTSEDIHALVRQGSSSCSSSSNQKRSELPVKSVSLANTRAVLPGTLAVESRIPSFLQNLPDVDIVAKMAAGRGRKDNCNGAIQSWFGVSNVIKKEREEAERCANEFQHLLSLPAILQELSHHNDRNEERKSCLLQLMKKSREETKETWDEYFNTVLLILLETLADADGSMRALSLRVLSEFLRCHPERFHEYVELTVVRSLEAHRDSVKEVTRAAEECSNLLSRIISPERCHIVLGPLIESDDFPINLAAVKMMTQVIEEVESSIVVGILPHITPSLLKAYDNNQSSVRKSSVICLVAVYMCVGEEIRPYLQDLHGSKVKLLNVYIKRALDQQTASSCATSKTSSPTSVVEA